MIDIPLYWRDANLRKRHFVGGCSNNEGDLIITSRWWNRFKQRWVYVAETREDIVFQIRLAVEHEKARTV